MSQLLKGTTLVVVASGFKGLASVLVGVVLARHLGPSNLGVYQMILTVITMWATFGGLGVGRSTLYFENNKSDPGYQIIGHGVAVGFVLALFSSFGFLVMAINGSEYIGKSSPIILKIGFLSVFIVLLQSILRPILLSQKKIFLFSLTIALAPYLQLIAIASLLYLDMLSINTVLATSLIIQGAVFFVSWFGLYHNIKFATVLKLKDVLIIVRHGIKLHLSNVLLFLDKRLVILLIPLLIPGEFSAVGYFSRAVAICGVFRILLGYAYDVLYSNWSRLNPESRLKQAQKTSRILLALGFIPCLAIFFLSNFLIVTLYGAEYVEAVNVLEILIFQQLLWSVTKVFQSFYAAEGRPNKTNIGLIVMLIAEIPLIYLLLGYFGLEGIAIALLISQVIFIASNLMLLENARLADCKKWLVIEKEDFYFLRNKMMKNIKIG